MEDWYGVSVKQVRENKGSGLIKKHNYSLVNLLKAIYPDYQWLPWKFRKSPRGFWSSKDNRYAYLRWIETKLGISEPSMWYHFTSKRVFIENDGGGILIKHYKGSPYELLKDLYPDFKWEPRRFNKAPHSYWKNEENVKESILSLSTSLKIKNLDDWYRVSAKQLHHLGVAGLVNEYGSLYKPLKIAYPQHDWDKSKFSSKSKRASQRWLYVCLRDIFGDRIDIFEDFRYDFSVEEKEKAEKYAGYPLQFDFWIPSYNIAIEYQGEQHFQHLPHFSSLEAYREWDRKKQEFCEEVGISLIEIPHWWDGNEDSLIASIHTKRPYLKILRDKPEE
eukprot:TRINITY_DN2859_c0_g3_i4.p2 TRINITY_DN2859_c0_g3~~TRINITY_DN2859_c0_g3_i4.p2  ORF type:complete len:333 (-),score=32.63 TRINITY_DN2859_c0_g3_i4:27-1025(-)